MSCSEIQVTILGDIADVQALVTEINASRDSAQQSATNASQSAIQARQSATEAAQAPAKFKTQDDGSQRGVRVDTYNFKGDGVSVTAKPGDVFDIEIPGADKTTNITDIQGLQSALNQLRNQKIDGVTSQVDEGKREITFTFTADGSPVATDTVDLNVLFGRTLVDAQVIYYGFSTSDVMTPTIIKSGTSDSVRTVNGYDAKLTRVGSDLKFIFFWVPDVFGDVTGFKFSGTFLDVWRDVEITVDGVPGKVYISDYPTASTSVLFEVDQ